IYLGDKKIVGILTEATTRVTRESQIILGMGINFAISEFPSALTERATSLFFDEPPTISADNLIGEIWAQFEQLQHADFMALYKAHSFILGKKITFTQSGQDFTGRAMDLSAQGELIVACDDGTTKILNSGEISLTSWN
ncbi:MAG: biotin--[acetyl-CoA-carboxylase] ligase, partial [Streptococcaceae bacterium]|nr:biotin--[acetyl-CoA-carboxylase] ligase [Streptococcaceae bacterium]